jgi:hypothetical protein
MVELITIQLSLVLLMYLFVAREERREDSSQAKDSPP